MQVISDGENRANYDRPAVEKKVRNSQPPYLSLEEAVFIAQQIYEQSGGTADSGTLSKLLGNSSSSSSFSRKLQALRIYRLTTSMTPPVTLSEIGQAIVAPRDESQRLLNLKGAAIGPENFRSTYERFKGKLLPQDEYLLNVFQHDVQVPKHVAQLWLSSFKAAMDYAQLLYLRPDGKTQVMDGPGLPQSSIIPPSPEIATAPEATPTTESVSKKELGEKIDEANGHNTRIALSGGRFASIYIPDRISARDAVRLKGALTGISSIIDSMVDEPE